MTDYVDTIIQISKDVGEIKGTLEQTLERFNQIHQTTENHNDRISSLEGSRFKVYGAAGLLSFCGGILAWVMGDK